MAENDTKAPPPPPPKPAAKPAVAPEAHGAAAAKQSTANKLLRPFKYLWGVVAGGVKGSLDGTAQWANRGMWLGMGLVLLAGLATGGTASLFIPLLIGGGLGFLGGGLAGATGGLAAGAINGVRRQYRADKYADDLVDKAKAKAAPLITPRYRDGLREQAYRNDVLQGLTVAQQRELKEDTTFWQDRVSQPSGQGRGF